MIGAPWIEARRLAAELKAARVPGVDFIPIYFTPSVSTNRAQRCGGVNLILLDREKFNSVLTGLTLISVLYRLYPQNFEIDKTLRLLGNQQALNELKSGKSPQDIERAATASMGGFLAGRQKALIYE